MSKRGRKRYYGRDKPQIQPRRTVYIICEGGKTEYSYLMAIKRTRRLRTVHIDLDPGSRSGCDPKSLLKYAKGKRNEGEYDYVWCVFDHDGRPYIDEVLVRARQQPSVNVAFSNPCFELWYFLHYEYSAGPCTQHKMVQRLKKYIPDYTKSKDMFSVLPDKGIAAQRASNLRGYHTKSGNQQTENPSTTADILVELLYSLEDPRSIT